MEWHLTPEYIYEHWTEELLTLMFMKRKRRVQRKAEAEGLIPREVSNEQAFEKAGIEVERVG